MYLLSDQSKRNLLSYLITFVIYLPFLIWWGFYSSTLSASPSHTDSSEISIDLSVFQEEISPPTDLPIEEEPEEIVKEETIVPKPIVKEIIPIPKEPLSQQPKPIVTKKPLPKKRVLKKKTTKKSSKKKQLTKTKRNLGSSKKAKSIGKHQFTRQLKAKINKNKRYPRIAQKRGMQGSVKVRFTINKSGKLTNLVASGSRIFVNSAKKAVKRSFPVSTKGVSLPMNVSLTISYHLK